MIRNLLVFVLFATSSCLVMYGQTPDGKKGAETAPKAFAWSFDGDDGSYLGVQTQEVTKENFSKFGLRDVRGVAVEKVVENSPAAAAGLLAGDVIVRFEAEDVTGTRKLTRLISEVAPDHQAKVTILRNGSEREINVTLAKRPAPAFENGTFEWSTPTPLGEMPKMPQMREMPLREMPGFRVAPGGDGNFLFLRGGSGRQIGVEITKLTKQLGNYFGVAGGTGVLISSVRENSPAGKAGLKAGDVIIEVDGKALKGDGDLMRALNEKKEGDIELTIIRDRNRQTVRVTPETAKGDGEALFEQFGDQGQLAPMKIAPVKPGAMTIPSPAIINMPGRIL